MRYTPGERASSSNRVAGCGVFVVQRGGICGDVSGVKTPDAG
jgi:hypothetical protein